MRKGYVYKANYFVEGDVDDFENNSKIDKVFTSIESALVQVNAVSTNVIMNDISENPNWGKCIICETMVTNRWEEECIAEFSNGAIWNGEWHCDICLPKDHANSFFGPEYEGLLLDMLIERDQKRMIKMD